MTPAEYAAFVDEVRASHSDEEAARIIEAACHPPYRRPRRGVLFPPAIPAEFTARHPKSRDHRTLAEQAADAAGTEGGAA